MGGSNVNREETSKIVNHSMGSETTVEDIHWELEGERT